MRSIYLAATLGAFGFAGLCFDMQAAAALGLGQQYPQACASGYHADAGGNCQPDAAQTNRFCATGLVYEPDPLGWRCVRPSREAY